MTPSPEGLTALRLKLRDNGFLPVPVLGAHVDDRSAGKRPILRAWETVCLTADETEIKRWAARLRSSVNTGLLCGNLVGVDIDVLDCRLSEQLADRAFALLGATPFRRIGLAPKILLCYRVATPILKLTTPVLLFDNGEKSAVEILAQGQQFVAFGIHPKTQSPYRWVDASPIEARFCDLPVATTDALEHFTTEAEAILREAGGATARERKEGASKAKSEARQGEKRERKGRIAAALHGNEKPDRDTVADALACIPNDLDYDDWIRIGFALYEGLGDAARDLWEQWSATSSKNDPVFTTKKWPSFANHRGVTIATLFWFARESGWRRKKRSAHDRAQREAAAAETSDNSEADDENDQPLIRIIGGNLPAVVTLGEQAMIAAGLGIFQRGNMIVRPTSTKVATAHGGKTSAIRLVPARSHHVAELLTGVAQWERFDMRSEAWVRIDCPQRIADTYLAREGHWRVPTLSGIINRPTLRPDGSVLQELGYDETTGLLFDPQGAQFSAVPTSPSRADARDALEILRGVIATFPFVSREDEAVALSAILTVTTRRSIATAPLHAFSAPTAGTGKSLLVDIASEIADGRPAAVMAMGRTEDEAEKRLGAALMAGDAIVSIDNVDRPFGGELYCQALTQTTLKVRVLGLSKLVETPTNAAIFATGNNFTLVGDMTRRALLCTLDAGVERPETRQFNVRPLDMIRSDRNRYVRAALTILRAFHVAGRPIQKPPLGSFEGWSHWVRDALLWLDQADPCATMEKVRANDPKLEALVAAMSQWDELIGSDPVSVKTVIDKATEQEDFGDNFYGGRKPRNFRHPEFREALLTIAGDGGAINSRRLGRWLSAQQGRIVDGRRFVPGGIREGIARWCLQAASPPQSSAQAQPRAPLF